MSAADHVCIRSTFVVYIIIIEYLQRQSSIQGIVHCCTNANVPNMSLCCIGALAVCLYVFFFLFCFQFSCVYVLWHRSNACSTYQVNYILLKTLAVLVEVVVVDDDDVAVVPHNGAPVHISILNRMLNCMRATETSNMV